MAKKTVTISNISSQSVTVNVKPSPTSSIFAGDGMTTIGKGKSITVEETRVNFSVLKRLGKLGLIRTNYATQKDAVVPAAPSATLDLSFTYAIGGPATSMSPDEIISGLSPLEFAFSAIVITNDGDLDANVSAASLSPGSDASINGFGASTISEGGTNSFNLNWGAGGGGFDEDLTITINGTDYVFTFQGTIQTAGN